MTIAILFALMWVLGMIISFTMGGFIHVLLGLAVVLLIVRYKKNRGPNVGGQVEQWRKKRNQFRKNQRQRNHL